ncbi:hypothetical protein Tco_0053725 [Tanacetum coccineum]
MCTYLKNMEGKKLKDLKNKSFDSIQKMFDRAFKRVNTFFDFRTDLVEGSSKRAGEKLEQENTKKQKVDEDKDTTKLQITAALIDVNAAQSKLVLLENFNENYSKCLRLLYKVNAAERVNAASEEVSTAELVSTAYVISLREASRLALAAHAPINIDQSFSQSLMSDYIRWITIYDPYTDCHARHPFEAHLLLVICCEEM